MATQDELLQLLELERAGWDSLCENTGDEFYGNVMTGTGRRDGDDDFTGI